MTDEVRPPEDSWIALDGPWRHRGISANGIRLHVAEAGSGPLVVLLHGFPQFWWSWRAQLPALAEAGLHAVAPDLRGYGASDKPPRGYDVLTAADDVAGLIKALGERSAILVGSDWGAVIAWTVASLHPEVTAGLVALGMPHPLRLREALRTDPAQLRASGYLARFQVPRLGERWLTVNRARHVEELLAGWSGPVGLAPPAVETYRQAMLVPGVAYCSLEYFRWAVRSLLRPDGRRAARLVRTGVAVPTIALHGQEDRVVLPATALGSEQWVAGSFLRRMLPGVGHFPAEEAPEEVTAAVLELAGRSATAAPTSRSAEPPVRAETPAPTRDRDPTGRARSSRQRDRSGRPLPRGLTGEPTLPDDAPALAPEVALQEADRLIRAGRPFVAHEVLETSWKAAPTEQRELWRGLAQLAVGLTHAQRGNQKGALSLLRRGSLRVADYTGPVPAGLDRTGLVADADALISAIETGGTAAAGFPPTPRAERIRRADRRTTGTDRPAADGAAADGPAAREPGAEGPGADTPGAEGPGADTPGADGPGPRRPTADGAAGSPRADQPRTDGPVAGGPAGRRPGPDGGPGAENVPGPEDRAEPTGRAEPAGPPLRFHRP